MANEKLPIDITQVFIDLSLLSKGMYEPMDTLNKCILDIEARINALGIGVSAWITLSVSDKIKRELGFTKVKAKWGLYLRTTVLDNRGAPTDDVNIWLFNEAPIWMRLDAVISIPDLLLALGQRVIDTCILMKKRLVEVNEMVAAIKRAEEEIARGTTTTITV